MKYAILSDIHSNFHALTAVIKDAKELKCEEFVCLGDIVGYAAYPSECLEVIRSLSCSVVMGNHDEVAAGIRKPSYFNHVAYHAIQWTINQLNLGEKEWLSQLPLQKQVNNFTIVHSSLINPNSWKYICTDQEAVQCFQYQQTTYCFFGHTHIPSFFQEQSLQNTNQNQINKILINPGSVGQPRDRDWRASYLIYDTENNQSQLRRIQYDVQAAGHAIRKAGLPVMLAERILHGC